MLTRRALGPRALRVVGGREGEYAPADDGGKRIDGYQPAQVVEELRRLLPEAVVCGGDFERLLPHPADVPRQQRLSVKQKAEAAATEHFLREVSAAFGVPEAPARTPDGPRAWPAEFAGSVTHKGTVVAVAMCPVSVARTIGVDIEQLDGLPLNGVHGLMADGEAPAGLTVPDAQAVVFSVKEAVFKAMFPIFGRRMGFDEVRVTLGPNPGGSWSGRAVACDGDCLVRVSLASPGWVASAAIYMSSA